MSSAWVSIDWAGRAVDIEYRWVGRLDSAEPPLVFLHEGLGSVSMWRDFPAQLCTAAGRRGLVYSRPGYGQSTARGAGESWGIDFMHRQAQQVLPTLLDTLGIIGPVDLFGHSDGGSIALLFAAHHPWRVRRLVVLAPHILVEEFGLVSIRQARDQYLQGDLRQRLARYHADVDSAFWGWNDVLAFARVCTLGNYFRLEVHWRADTGCAGPWTTFTAPWPRLTASRPPCPARGYSSCSSAGIRRTATNPRP